MEQHPIPQDVTGFQFKLIGTMTVKQFGYVASGVVAAVVLYYLPISSAFGILLKILLIPLLGSSGAIIAFIPVDGRPIDVMTANFMKALFSPNQYIYYRNGRKLSFTMLSPANAPSPQKIQQKGQTHKSTDSAPLDQKEEKLRALLFNSHGRVQNDLDRKETAFLSTLTTPASQAPTTMTKPSVLVHPSMDAPRPTIQVVKQQLPQQATQPQAPITPRVPTHEKNENELSKKETALEQALTQAKQEASVSETPTAHNAAQQKTTLLSKQIEEVHAQKQQLEQELSHLQKQLASQKGTGTSLPIAPTQPVQNQLPARNIPQTITEKVGLPRISDSPNVVVGIVKDPRGNILPNILVEVKDKDSNPVRAFKTNQLGQFASATPLSLGTYTIELEDPKKQQRFDVVQITANNQVLLPIEVVSHDAREELRKQLFAS